jgi:hypothetical protein
MGQVLSPCPVATISTLRDGGGPPGFSPGRASTRSTQGNSSIRNDYVTSPAYRSRRSWILWVTKFIIDESVNLPRPSRNYKKIVNWVTRSGLSNFILELIIDYATDHGITVVGTLTRLLHTARSIIL